MGVHLLTWRLWQAQAGLAYVCVQGPSGVLVAFYWARGAWNTSPRWRKEIATPVQQGLTKVERKLPVRLQRLKALVLDLGILWGEVLLGMTLCRASGQRIWEPGGQRLPGVRP